MGPDPTNWHRAAARLGCSPAEALAVAIVLCGGALGLALLWWQQRPVAVADGVVVGVAEPTSSSARQAGPPGAGPPGHAPTPRASPEPASTSSMLAVHVTGAVKAPGVYELPAGARVVDAVTRAGGPTAAADLDRLNLALAVADGMQVRVPRPGETVAPPSVAPPSVATPAGDLAPPLDLNTADATALEQLPGVGPVTAGKIVEHRAAIGRYARVEELLDIRGIGESTLAEIAPRVTVGG